MRRLRNDDRVDLRMALVNLLVQSYRTARNLAGFNHTVLYLYDVARFDVPTGYARRGNQEVIASPTYGYRTVRADHQTLIAGTTNHLDDQRTDGTFV